MDLEKNKSKTLKLNTMKEDLSQKRKERRSGV